MYIYLVFFFAFLLRLVNLNQSLWLDEAIVAKVVRSIPLLQIPIQFSPGDFHPPLYYLFMSIWSNMAGYSEISLRMPSIIFSLIVGLYVYKMGCLIKDKRTGFWAAVFFLFNPLIVYYSQEARMYMMATAFLSIALYYFIRITKNNSHLYTDIILFNIFSAFAMLTFYGSIFFIVGMISLYVISTKRSAWRNLSTSLPMTKIIIAMTWGLLVSLLLLSPLLFQQLHNAAKGLSEVKNWSLVLGKVEIKNLAIIFLKFATGRISWYPKWSYYLTAGIPTVILWIFVLLGMKKNRTLTFIFFFPLFLGIIVSLIAPMMQYFRFLYLIPVISLLLGQSVTATMKEHIKKSPIFRFLDFARNDVKHIFVTLVFLTFSFLYLFNPQFHREDWKAMVADLKSSIPVYMILPSSDPVVYYNPTLSLHELRDIQKETLGEQIIVIPYVEEIYGFNHVLVLEELGCYKEAQYTFRGPLSIEQWKCPALSFIRHTSIRSI